MEWFWGLRYFSMYPAMGVALYRWGVMANLARICGISFNREWGVSEFHGHM